ncbi:MAG: sodium-dependent transporter [Dehalococcoidia bacterium]|nr:MAG: sodium-dependent transporter [Dehalococcoidia bacterium]
MAKAAVRERWSNRPLFIFAAIGSAIGLGNVWRFPYLTYEYGGGAFLIPWIIGLIVLGVPWMVMEFGMGRYFQKSAPGLFEGIGKKWEWLGWWPVFVAFIIVTYYSVVMAWALRYMFSSFTMAWGVGQAGAEGAGGFFFGEVLNLSGGPTELGGLQWALVGFLVFIWVLLFLIMFKGASVIGKVAVWTVTIPWALLVVLLIRGLTLPGAVQGLNYYLTPDPTKLGSPDVWFAALSQIAFTLSLGMAGMFAYGSFVAKKADITNSAFITSFSNCATSFFAGFAVFSTVGFIMQALSIPVGEVSASGLGLAFVSYPVAISMMPAANALIGVLFFLCLFFLGIDSAFFLSYGGVISPIMDKFGMSRVKATAWVCVVAFLVGLLYTTQGGLFWLDMMDRAVSFYGLLITGALACLVVGWVFGAAKLREHVNETSDIKVGAWFDWLIKLIVPVGLLFVVIYGGFMKDLAAPYEGYQVGALSGSHIIWLVLGVTLVLSFVLQAIKTKGVSGE